jgi:hypothetical protein
MALQETGEENRVETAGTAPKSADVNETETAILGIDTTDPRTGRETVDVTATDTVGNGAMKGNTNATVTTDTNAATEATTAIMLITRETATIEATNMKGMIDPIATTRTTTADQPTGNMTLMTVVVGVALGQPLVMMQQQ